MNIKHKIVLISGASSGIGYATAQALAEQGATVVAVARREAELKTLIEHCQHYSPESCYLAGDLGERAFAEYCIDETVRRFGRLDILINNAAIPLHKLIYRISVEEAEQVMRVNFNSCLWTCFRAIPPMLKQGGGHIVNVSSFASIVTPTHETIYAASKCAMNGFTKGLQTDLSGSGIHCTLLHPGPIATEIWDKLEEADAYSGKRYPPELVAREMIRAIQKKKLEVVVPRWNLNLILARIMNTLAPRLVRMGVLKMDPITLKQLAWAKQKAAGDDKAAN